MKLLFKNLLLHKKYIFFIIILSVVCVILSTFIPYFIGKAVNSTSKVDDSVNNDINKYILYILIFSFTFSLGSYLIVILSSKLSYKIVSSLRCGAFSKIHKMPLSSLDKMNGGEINSLLINDLEALIDGLTHILNMFLFSFLSILFSAFMMIYLNLTLGLIIIFVAIIALMISRFISKNAFKFIHKATILTSKYNSYTAMMINQSEIVNSFNYNDVCNSESFVINKELSKARTKAMFYTSLNGPVSRFINNITYILVGLIGGYIFINKSEILSIATITSLLFYANMFSKPLSELSAIQTDFSSSMVAFKKIHNFLNTIEDDNSSNKILKINSGNIKFENINFSYDENQKLITNFNLEVKSGEKIAIVGPTGAGKTTIVNLLMRFYEPQSGKILIDGINIYDCSKESLRQNIGMVLQNTWLKNATIKENILYADNALSFEALLNVTRITGIDEFIDTTSDSYNTKISENSTSISQGQKQLITIARAIILDPKILILDEATSNIDTRSEVIISNALDNIMKNKTTFVIAHRLKTIKNANKILVLDKGNIVEIGSHDELLAKKGFYYNLYNHQFLEQEKI